MKKESEGEELTVAKAALSPSDSPLLATRSYMSILFIREQILFSYSIVFKRIRREIPKTGRDFTGFLPVFVCLLKMDMIY